MKLNIFLLSAAALANGANGHTTTGESAIDLGSAEEFVILAKDGISTVPDSSITGDIGVSPAAATYITGFSLVKHTEPFSTSTQIAGGSAAYAANYAKPTPVTLITAVSDMEAAYNEALDRSNDDDDRTNLGGEHGRIGGMTLHPGVYTFAGDIMIGDDIFLDGNEDDVFIIQTSGNILQADATKVELRSGNHGVQASNVFWQVAGHVTVGAGSEMQGILLVKGDALFETKSSLNGRVFAQTTVDLQKTSVTQPTTSA